MLTQELAEELLKLSGKQVEVYDAWNHRQSEITSIALDDTDDVVFLTIRDPRNHVVEETFEGSYTVEEKSPSENL